jgi:hypothetical protein
MIAQPTSTKRTGLIQNVQTILRQRYRLRAGQKILVLFDVPKESIGKIFAAAARQIGANVDTIRMGKNRFTPQFHQSIAEQFKAGGYDLFVNVIEARLAETDDRLRMVKEGQMPAGGGIAHAPGIEESMLEIEVNYKKMAEDARKLLAVFKHADEARVKTALGTDLRIGIERRKFHDDAILRKNNLGNFPCGEIYCAPIEDQAEGVMIADASVGNGIGILPQPLRFEVEKGKIVEMGWLYNPAANSRLLRKIRETLFQDTGASIIGELGIGLAPYPICGNLLQDEKVAGTIHIAFGDNDFFGGQNHSVSHVDFLVKSPELTVRYGGLKPSRIIMRDGKLLT